MKTSFLTVLMMALCSVIVAQSMPRPVKVVEKGVIPARFTGVRKVEYETIGEYLNDKIVFHEITRMECQQGVNVTRFTVLPSGDLANFEVINSVSDEIDHEVIRVLKTSKGMWEPAKKNGEAIAQNREVAFCFKLEGADMNASACDSFQKANRHVLQGNFKKALKCYDKVVAYCPYNTGILYQRGIVKLKLGDKEGAFADFRRVHELGSDLAAMHLEP